MQNNLKRKREITEDENEYEPPRKIRVLDEDQVYISESSDGSTTDGDISDGDHSSDLDYKTTSDDRDFLETTNDSIPRGDENKDESDISIDIPHDKLMEEDRQSRLRKQWKEILPKIKRTTQFCDLPEGCKYHFPHGEEDDDKENGCLYCSS